MSNTWKGQIDNVKPKNTDFFSNELPVLPGLTFADLEEVWG